MIDEETLVRICITSFSAEEISKSKTLLFDSVSVGRLKIKRKNKGKEERDLVDIVNVFKSMEPDLFPIYVARDLDRLPPLVYDHFDCSKILKDLLKVQTEINDLKATYVTKNELSDLKTELLLLKNNSLTPSVSNVNTKRGGWMLDSDPVGLINMSNSSLSETNNINIGNESTKIGYENNSKQCKDISYKGTMRVDTKQNECESAVCQRSLLPKPVSDGELRVAGIKRPTHTSETPVPATATDRGPTNQLITTQLVKGSEPSDNDNDNGWQRVSKRRKPMKYRYIGKAGSCRDNEGKFKAVDKRVAIFITKIHKDTTENDIIDYVYRKTQETIILEKISFAFESDYKAYKFHVLEHKSSIFLDSNLWPQGIIFRKFVNFKGKKQKNTNGNINAVVGTNTSQ